jgi:putative membrane protein
MNMSGSQLVYLSAERTLLTWIRLAATLMGVGFVLDRFGLILQHEMVFDSLKTLPRWFSFWGGILLIILGIITDLAVLVIYTNYVCRYRREGYIAPDSGMLLGQILCVLTALVGTAAVFFLTTLAH